MNLDLELEIFGIEEIPEMSELKAIYRKLVFDCHPDQGGSNEKFIALQNAYDILSTFAECGATWLKTQEESLVEWEAKFKKRWRAAYQRSRKPGDIAPGLHFQTFILGFARMYIYPPKEWFYGVLFAYPTDKNQSKYRAHLENIAPNPKMKESWCKRYWELEFCQSWVFYLPGTLKELRAEKNQLAYAGGDRR